jgi:putative RNA 2'-phosphotransferase
MKPEDAIGLSKMMSRALRHKPASVGITVDEAGWVDLATFVDALAGQRGWAWVTLDDVVYVVETSDKQRFEINEGHIRARYGHSRAARPQYKQVTPPQILYHGTPRRNLPQIRREGLKAMSRQYVHLSATPDMALRVGRRRDPRPALLIIRAAEAHAAGITFGTPSGGADDIYLVELLPPDYIEFPDY